MKRGNQNTEQVSDGPSSITEEQLDPANWVSLYGDELYRLAVFQLRDRSRAEDLVQDTFVLAIKAIDRFERRCSVKSWLSTILRNRIIDEFRQSKHWKTESLDAEAFEERDSFFNRIGVWKRFVSSWGSDPEKLFEGREFMQVFSECLSKLPPRNRELLILRMLHRIEVEEICSNLNVSKPNFWVIIHRGRMLLRDCLEKNWIKS